MTDLVREFRFALRDGPLRLTVLAALVLSALSVGLGIAEVAEQRRTIETVAAADAAERAAALEGQSDWGSAAYYAFHATYDPPSDIAFAALGRRGDLPWRHRIRMLALEGQIYEADTGNAALSRAGFFDFAFVASVLAPLLVLLALHDVIARERAAGRRELLESTAGGSNVFAWRALVRGGLIALSLVSPLFVGSVVAGASALGTVGIALVTIGHVALWSVLALLIARRTEAAPTAAAKLLGLWLLFVAVVPVAGRMTAEVASPVPNGGDILLTQREAVNDAWDLPKEATMTAFLERHPQWAAGAEITEGFEWKWYYAFQQVGDQVAEPLSVALREGVATRDRLMGLASLLSPTLATERLLTRLADTDAAAARDYEACVRAFHAELRVFHYPLMFEDRAYDERVLDDLPRWLNMACARKWGD